MCLYCFHFGFPLFYFVDEGYLLFLVHVNDIAALQIGCRLKGESVVSQVWLNGVLEKQVSLVNNT